MGWLLLRKYWLYLALIAAVVTLYVAVQYDKAQYHKLSADFSAYRTQVAEANLTAEKAARAAVEAQQRERAKIDKANSEVMDAYSQKLAALEAARDHARELARRLLAASQAKPAGAGGHLPETDNRSSAPEARPDAGDGLADRLVRVAAECRGNAAQLTALIGQIQPQL